MTDWTWEYIPDSAEVTGGLTPEQVADVEAMAQRVTDAVTVRRIGRPYSPEEGVSDVKSFGEGILTIWYLEDYRDDTVLVCRVQHLGPDAGTSGG